MQTHTDILKFLVEKYKFQSYLEIGVNFDGANFNQINVVDKIGVPPQPLIYPITSMYSDEFFTQVDANKKWDLILNEGVHTLEQTYIDAKNSIKHLNEGGFILIHDCNPPTEYHQRPYEEFARMGGAWNGQAYKAFIRLKSELKNWSCFVIDIDWGCAILTPRKILENKQLTYGVGKLYWEVFDKYRKELMQLITIEEFENLINKNIE
jgi:hypothetical protein